MKKGIFYFVLAIPFALHAQFNYTGQVAKEYANSEVYLSFIDDYRKTSRTYVDQIIYRSITDSLGHFSFKGNNLPYKNGIYRIHADKCANDSANSHFLRECAETIDILFIANNRDTLNFPLTRHDQPFCSVISTNSTSEYLLEVDALKEEMILDFMEHGSQASKTLNFKKWFDTLQHFGLQTQEPLVEIYSYAFLSDRANETRDYYLKELSSDDYYQNLFERLQEQYPESPLTKMYQNELHADLTLVGTPTIEQSNKQLPIFYGLGLVIAFGLVLFFWKKSRSLKTKINFEKLTAQERKIASAILANKTNKEIANELFISLSTVKTHINSIYKKLGVTSREEVKSNFHT